MKILGRILTLIFFLGLAAVFSMSGPPLLVGASPAIAKPQADKTGLSKSHLPASSARRTSGTSRAGGVAVDGADPAPQASEGAPSLPLPVIVTELSWTGDRLIVGTDRPLRFRTFSLREPDRVVLDLFDAELGDPTMARILSVQRDPVRQIRVGAHPEGGFLRVVIDGDRPIPVQISQPRGRHRLVIRPQDLAPGGQTRESPEDPDPAGPAEERQASSEVLGPPETFGPPERLAARSLAASAETKPFTPESPKPRSKELLGDAGEATPSPDREAVGVRIAQSDGNTLLTLRGARTLRLRIQQGVDPPRLVVQIPSGALKGHLPKARGQIESLKVSEDGGQWVLEAKLLEGPLDIQNRLEDDGKTLVLAIRRQKVSTSKRPLVLIDPGHGGDDPGAVGAGGTRESEVNLAIALKLQVALQAQGVNAVLTRTGDVGLDLATRTRMIDQFGAQALVSVHANSHDASSALGLETYFRTSVSQPFAQQIHQVLVTDLQRPDRGVREAQLFVLRHPTIPSALIEAGFISNPAEEVLLGDAAYQRKAAEAIAKGVLGYLSTPVAELSH